MEGCRGYSFLSRWSFKNVSCYTRTIQCITRQSRIAARQCSGTQNSRSSIGNVGRSRAASWFRIVNSLSSDKEFTFFCTSRVWAINWLTVAGFLYWCTDNSCILACLARSVSSQQILLNSSISWQSLAWSSWKSLFLNSDSPYKLILSLWAWSAHRLAWCSWNRWDSNSWLISWKAKSEFSLFPISCLNLKRQLHTIFAELLSLLGGPSKLSVQGFLRDFLYLSTNAQRLCLDLSCLSSVN